MSDPPELCTGEYWVIETVPSPTEKLALMRERVLALKKRLEHAMPRMGNGDIVKELERIAKEKNE